MTQRFGGIFHGYLDGGLSLIPCGDNKPPNGRLLPIDPADNKPTWKPYQRRQPTSGELTRWLDADAQSFAVVCGAVSGGLEIIDIDDNQEAEPLAYAATDFYEAWLAEIGQILEQFGLVVQRTGGGGYQVAYRCAQPGGNQKLAWVQDERQEHGRSVAIETRGEGGYAVIAPSIHPSGNQYRMIYGGFANVPVIPQQIRDILIDAAKSLDLMPYTSEQIYTATEEHKQSIRGRYKDEPSVIATYNDRYRIADVLAQAGYTRGHNGRYSRPGKGDSLGVVVLERDNVSFHWSSNDPLHRVNAGGNPVPRDPFAVYCMYEHGGDVREAVRDAAKILGLPSKPQTYTNGHSKPPGAQTMPDEPPDESYLLSEGFHDEGNAQCVNLRYKSRFLCSQSLGWLTHNGTHWTMAEAEAAVERAITETLIARLNATVKADKGADVVKKFIPNSGRVQGAKSQLHSLVSVSSEAFDSEPDYLNCKNGVVNLRTGEVMPHDPAQRFLHCVTVAYRPNADQTPWRKWLVDAVGQEAADWLQLAIGYGITGHTREEILFYLYGPPRSGKGTFTETMIALFGSTLAREVDFGTFVAQRTGGSQNFDLAPLKPCRFIAASETNTYERFNEAKVKKLTGGNDIYCAFKHKDHFNYRPQFKIWLSSNQPVNADPDDDAVWGRIRVVEFPHSHLGDEDKELKSSFRTEAILQGILAWAVDGAKLWYALGSKGLPELETGSRLKAQQRGGLDNVQAWIDDHCYKGAEAFGTNDKLYPDYEQWCKLNGIEPKKQKGFSVALKRKGFADGRNSVGKRGFKGLGLLSLTD